MYPASKCGTSEYNAAHQPKAKRKTYTEGYEKCGDVRTDSGKPEVQYLFLQNIVIAHIVQCNVQKSISPTAGQVTESLNRDEFPERRVKQINKRYDQVFRHI